MDYFQGVVAEYLRADRRMFLNTECLIQIAPGAVLGKGTHWYCDIVAASFHDKTAYLFEITYSKSLNPLIARLRAWQNHWPKVVEALHRDCEIPAGWGVRPWVFIPQGHNEVWLKKFNLAISESSSGVTMPGPIVTALEKVVPWSGHRTWDRRDENEKGMDT